MLVQQTSSATTVSCSWRTARERTRKTQKSVSKAIGPLTPVTRGGTVLAGSKSGTLPSVHVTVPPRYPPDTTCPIQWRYGTAQSVVGRWAAMPAGGLQPWAPPHGGHAAADTHVCDLRRSTVVPPRRGLTSQSMARLSRHAATTRARRPDAHRRQLQQEG